MKKLTIIKTNYKNYYDLIEKQPYLKRVGAYNPLPLEGKDYDVIGTSYTYGLYRYMPVRTKIPTASSIFVKWNSARGSYDILFLSR